MKMYKKAFTDKTHKESIDHDHCYYIFYYRVMQEMMFQMSYPAFKYYTTSVLRQLLKHHKDFMNSFDEWTSNPEDEEDLFGGYKMPFADVVEIWE